jgi:F-type H+-transporting ATPase subunit gamma
MGRRHHLDQRLRSLAEIRDIMGAMKNLALIETRKLARVLQTEQRMLASIREAAGDFSRFHAAAGAPIAAGRDVCLLVGSERGFCGDFNDALLRELDALEPDAALIVTGSKLSARLPGEARIIEHLPGAAALEDVPSVLLGVMHALDRWHAGQPQGAPLRLRALHHVDDGIAHSALDPFAQAVPATPAPAAPPLLTLAPQAFAEQLVDHYVFAALHDIFYRSLAAENLRRMQHMDAAVRRLDQKVEALSRRGRSLRQEEITEEIEVILLSGELTHA